MYGSQISVGKLCVLSNVLLPNVTQKLKHRVKEDPDVIKAKIQ